MDQRNLASVLFAVVGVFVAVSRFPELFVHLALLAQPNPGQGPADPASQRFVTTAALSGALLAVLIGVALVLLRDRLASRLFPLAGHQLGAPEVQAVALSVLGCYFVVQGLPQVLWAGFGAGELYWPGAIQLLLGAGLFVGSRGPSRL